MISSAPLVSPVSAALNSVIASPHSDGLAGDVVTRLRETLRANAPDIIPEPTRMDLRMLKTIFSGTDGVLDERRILSACRNYVGAKNEEGESYATIVSILGNPEGSPWANVDPNSPQVYSLASALMQLMRFEDLIIQEIIQKTQPIWDYVNSLVSLDGERFKHYIDHYNTVFAHISHAWALETPFSDLLAWSEWLDRELAGLESVYAQSGHKEAFQKKIRGAEQA